MIGDLLGFVVERGLNLRASFCEARYFEERANSIIIENGVAKAMFSGILRGIGVRVIVGERCGFASTNILTREALERVLMDAISGAKSIMAHAGEETKIVAVEPSNDRVFHKVEISPEDVDPEVKVKRALELEKPAREFSDRIKDTLINY
ncbi:MAG: DNA gyrase modulator [Candidatus Bathyarchaeia archaeon]